MQSVCDSFLTLVFFSFHSGRTVSILRGRTVWRNRGSWNQWRETSENLCSPSWGEGLLILTSCFKRWTWGASTMCTRTSLGSTWTSWSVRRLTFTFTETFTENFTETFTETFRSNFHWNFQVREETGGHYRNTLLGLLPNHGRIRWVKHLKKNDYKAPNSQQKHKIGTKMFATSDQHNFLYLYFDHNPCTLNLQLVRFPIPPVWWVLCQ